MGRSDPTIMMGKPVIAATRLTVELNLEKLGQEKRPTSSSKRTRALPERRCLKPITFAALSLGAAVAYPIP